MNLADLLMLLLIVFFALMFWRFRAIAEKANSHLQHYCESQQLQLISVARQKTRIGSHRGKLDLLSEFDFEFSGNGEDSYLGTLSMAGLAVVELYTPVYRIH